MQPWGPALGDMKGIVIPTSPFFFPGLQSHPALPSGPPSTLLMKTPIRLPLSTTPSWLLDWMPTP